VAELAEGDVIGELRQSDHHYRLRDLLGGIAVGVQRVDIAAAHLGRLPVQFSREVEERLQGRRNVGRRVVDRIVL
jgi:hypothetical protein